MEGNKAAAQRSHCPIIIQQSPVSASKAKQCIYHGGSRLVTSEKVV